MHLKVLIIGVGNQARKEKVGNRKEQLIHARKEKGWKKMEREGAMLIARNERSNIRNETLEPITLGQLLMLVFAVHERSYVC
jgi:hypothetical protein